MVSHGNGLEWADRCGFTNTYRGGPPYQIHQAFDMCRRLPNLTGFLASPARSIGVLGLVYQGLPTSGSGSEPAAGHLYQALPPHRRHNTQWIGLCVMQGYNGLGTVIDCGEHPTGLPIQLMLDAVGFGLAVCFEWYVGRRVILVMH